MNSEAAQRLSFAVKEKMIDEVWNAPRGGGAAGMLGNAAYTVSTAPAPAHSYTAASFLKSTI